MSDPNTGLIVNAFNQKEFWIVDHTQKRPYIYSATNKKSRLQNNKNWILCLNLGGRENSLPNAESKLISSFGQVPEKYEGFTILNQDMFIISQYKIEQVIVHDSKSIERRYSTQYLLQHRSHSGASAIYWLKSQRQNQCGQGSTSHVHLTTPVNKPTPLVPFYLLPRTADGPLACIVGLTHTKVAELGMTVLHHHHYLSSPFLLAQN